MDNSQRTNNIVTIVNNIYNVVCKRMFFFFKYFDLVVENT